MQSSKKFLSTLIGISISFSLLGCTPEMVNLATKTLKEYLQADITLQKIVTDGQEAKEKQEIKEEDIESVELDGVSLTKDKYRVEKGKVIIKELDMTKEHILLIKIKNVAKPIPFKIEAKKDKKQVSYAGMIEYKMENGQEVWESNYSGEAENGEIIENADQFKVDDEKIYYWDPKQKQAYETTLNKEQPPKPEIFNKMDKWQAKPIEKPIFKPPVFKPCVAVFNPDGSIGLNDGSTVISANGYQKLSEGSFKLQDGRVIPPCGIQPPQVGPQPPQISPKPPQVSPKDPIPNCVAVFHPDGSIGLSDGRTVIPKDNYEKLPDGNIKLNDGKTIPICQNIVTLPSFIPSLYPTTLPSIYPLPITPTNIPTISPTNYPTPSPSSPSIKPPDNLCVEAFNSDGSIGLSDQTIIPAGQYALRPENNTVELQDGRILGLCSMVKP